MAKKKPRLAKSRKTLGSRGTEGSARATKKDKTSRELLQELTEDVEETVKIQYGFREFFQGLLIGLILGFVLAILLIPK